MTEATTKAGAEDRRPKRAEEVWIAIGPFTPAGKRLVVGALATALILLGAGIVALWGIRGEVAALAAAANEFVQVYKLRRP